MAVGGKVDAGEADVTQPTGSRSAVQLSKAQFAQHVRRLATFARFAGHLHLDLDDLQRIGEYDLAKATGSAGQYFAGLNARGMAGSLGDS